MLNMNLRTKITRLYVKTVLQLTSYFVFFRSDFENTFKEFSLNLHPSQDLMNQAYKVISQVLIKMAN